MLLCWLPSLFRVPLLVIPTRPHLSLGPFGGSKIRRSCSNSPGVVVCRQTAMNAFINLCRFPLLMRWDPALEKGALKLQILLGIPGNVYWILVGSIRMRIDDGRFPPWSCTRPLFRCIEVVQIICQIQEECPCLCLKLWVDPGWTPWTLTTHRRLCLFAGVGSVKAGEE